MQIEGIERTPGRHGRDGLQGQGPQVYAVAPRKAQVAKDRPEPMRQPDLVVTMADNEESGRVRNPATQEGQQIECGLVGPVRVLDHGDGRSAMTDRGQCGGEHIEPGGPRAQRGCEPGIGCRGEVVQRTEGSWCLEVVTAPPQCRDVLAVYEGAQQRCLADAGFAGDRAELADARLPDRGQERTEVGERFLALEQHAAPPATAPTRSPYRRSGAG